MGARAGVTARAQSLKVSRVGGKLRNTQALATILQLGSHALGRTMGAVITKSLAHLRQAWRPSPWRGIFEMLQARFGLGCHSGFPTATQKTPLPKTAPAPARAMPLEREPVSSVLLRRRIKRTNLIRN